MMEQDVRKSRSRPKRPDMPLYVPKAKRNVVFQKQEEACENGDSLSPQSVSSSPCPVSDSSAEAVYQNDRINSVPSIKRMSKERKNKPSNKKLSSNLVKESRPKERENATTKESKKSSQLEEPAHTHTLNHKAGKPQAEGVAENASMVTTADSKFSQDVLYGLSSSDIRSVTPRSKQEAASDVQASLKKRDAFLNGKKTCSCSNGEDSILETVKESTKEAAINALIDWESWLHSFVTVKTSKNVIDNVNQTGVVHVEGGDRDNAVCAVQTADLSATNTDSTISADSACGRQYESLPTETEGQCSENSLRMVYGNDLCQDGEPIPTHASNGKREVCSEPSPINRANKQGESQQNSLAPGNAVSKKRILHNLTLPENMAYCEGKSLYSKQALGDAADEGESQHGKPVLYSAAEEEGASQYGKPVLCSVAEEEGASQHGKPVTCSAAEEEGARQHGKPVTCSATEEGASQHGKPVMCSAAEEEGASQHDNPVACSAAEEEGVSQHGKPVACTAAEEEGASQHGKPVMCSAAEEKGATQNGKPLPCSADEEEGGSKRHEVVLQILADKDETSNIQSISENVVEKEGRNLQSKPVLQTSVDEVVHSPHYKPPLEIAAFEEGRVLACEAATGSTVTEEMTNTSEQIPPHDVKGQWKIRYSKSVLQNVAKDEQTCQESKTLSQDDLADVVDGKDRNVARHAATEWSADELDRSLDGGLSQEGIADDSWDSLFTEDGDCLAPVQEPTENEMNSQRRGFDFCSHQSKESDGDESELSHVIEIFSFPANFRTEDLLQTFSSYLKKGFDVRWVDDTHALGIFASPFAARDALSSTNPLVKVRPLSQASAAAKAKARRCSEFLEPARERPATTAALARRLVTGALGIKSTQTKADRDAERRKLQEARDRRRLEAKQRDDAWEGR